jgi:hypothetical protein
VANQKSTRRTGTDTQRLAEFCVHLLTRYRVKALSDLPIGPQQDFERACARSGVTQARLEKTIAEQKPRE